MDPISLGIQVLSGIVFGNFFSSIMKQSAIGTAARTILGAIGGLGGGLAYGLVGGNAAISGPLVDLYTGGFGGALLATITGAALTISQDGKRNH